jgi:hypothetical protein
MTAIRHAVLAACAIALALAGCGKQEGGASEKKSAAAPPKAVEEKPAPYTYPPPVKGHYKEINIGEFDLVDGIAYTATGGGGTVVYVTDKAIASPMLAESVCPMTQARALTELRNARDADVAVYSDRFLTGTTGEFTAKAGTSYLRVEGTNSKGKKFVNFYHFVPCGERLVLVSISENPQ